MKATVGGLLPGLRGPRSGTFGDGYRGSVGKYWGMATGLGGQALGGR